VKTIISLCDYTGNMLKPWAEAGYQCRAYDLLGEPPEPWPGVSHFRRDVTAPLLKPVPVFDAAAVFAFPPCTNTAVSGARWFKDKGLRGLIDALEVVEACRWLCEASGAPWLLENPVSTISTYWRKPDYTFHPCDYGDPYTKKTCLWTGGGFTMPPKTPVEPTEGSKMHLMAPSDDRAQKRSETPMGFAQAVFDHMHPQISGQVRSETLI
jgi:hypothetical protein